MNLKANNENKAKSHSKDRVISGQKMGKENDNNWHNQQK